MIRSTALAAIIAAAAATGCATLPSGAGPAQGPGADWAIAIHGGSGTIRDTAPEEEQARYRESLSRALAIGAEILEAGGDALDAVEAAVRALEDDPLFNAGRGGVPNEDGHFELDASIMDGRTLDSGGVGAVRFVRNPVSLARRVMEDTPHRLLAGDGALRFAREAGEPLEDDDYFRTEWRWERWQRMRGSRDALDVHGTVGAVARDRNGNLAAATSTGGLTDKRAGRVGDSPIAGAGNYADNATCAVSATGRGEEFMRWNSAFRIAAAMEHGGMTLEEAMRHVLRERMPDRIGGMIAVDRDGRLVLDFTTRGMYRGAADSTGRFEVAIFDEAVPRPGSAQ